MAFGCKLLRCNAWNVSGVTDSTPDGPYLCFNQITFLCKLGSIHPLKKNLNVHLFLSIALSTGSLRLVKK